MKLKENFKRFWTLSGSRKGFTLVELIVVIAILAILAGVAIPVYNGYIKKAETAADQQLLDTINTAFAAACIANNVDVTKLGDTNAKMPLDNGKVNIAGIKADDPTKAGDESADVQADFAIFYGENENSAFKDITRLIFVQQLDGENKYCFVDAAGNSNLELDPELAGLFNSSVFSDVGVGTLTSKVDYLASQSVAAGGALALLGSDEFVTFLQESGQFESYINAETGELDSTALSMTILQGDSSMAQMVSNASVLYIAKLANGVEAGTLVNAMANDQLGAVPGIGDLQGQDYTLTQAALRYGMLTAYYDGHKKGTEAQSTFDGTAINSTSDVTALWNEAMNSQDFKNYLAGESATSDASGFLAALEAVNNNKGNIDWSDMGSNSFFSSLTGEIEGLLGK